MTVIVVDARVGLIGADRYCTSGYYCRKVFKTEDRGIFGCAGHDTAIARFEDWILHNGPPPDQIIGDDGEGFEAIQLHNDRIFVWGKAMVGREVEDRYFAVGSGGDLALGALDAGATLERALQIAAYRQGDVKPPFDFMRVDGTLVETP